MSQEKIFILGIGAQKAGTTWLYQYIKSSPKASLGQLKEYHFWNMIFNKNHKKRLELFRKPQKELNSDDFLRWLMLTKKKYYEIYFNSIINSGFSITGDITPQYALLSLENFEYIRNALEQFGFKIKVIYFIRDPFERLWSNVRMEKNLYSSISKNKSDTEVLRMIYKDNNWKFDSYYHIVIERIKKIFKREDIFIGVFEEMFSETKARELSDFIGIDLNKKFIDKKINLHEKTEDVDTFLINEIRKEYKDIYDYCLINFPQTKDLWKVD